MEGQFKLVLNVLYKKIYIKLSEYIFIVYILFITYYQYYVFKATHAVTLGSTKDIENV